MQFSLSQIILPVLALTNVVYAIPVGGNNGADLSESPELQKTYQEMKDLRNQDRTAINFATTLAMRYKEAPAEDRSPLRMLRDYQTVAELGQRCTERLAQYKNALEEYEWSEDKDAEITKFAEANIALQESLLKELKLEKVKGMLHKTHFEAEVIDDLRVVNNPDEEEAFLEKELKTIREELDTSKESLDKYQGDAESFQGRFLQLQVWIRQMRLNAYVAAYKQD